MGDIDGRDKTPICRETLISVNPVSLLQHRRLQAHVFEQQGETRLADGALLVVSDLGFRGRFLVGNGGMDPYDSPLRSPIVVHGASFWEFRV